MRARPNRSNSREVRNLFADIRSRLKVPHRRTIPVLMTLTALVACALVGLSLATVAGPQTETGTCCSDPVASSTTTTQETTSTASTDAQPATTDPPGTIDGAKNPELIPDDVAYRVLFLAVAEPENPTEEQLARARAKISRAQLSEEDTAAFLNAATQFKAQIDSLAAQAAEISKGIAFVDPSSVQGRQLSQLGKQQDQVLANTLGALQTGLSAEGLQRLQAHIQSIKRNMKVYPPPANMPTF